MNASTETSTPNPTLVLRLIAITGVALSLFQLYAAGIEPLGLFFQRPIHLSFILVLCFLIYPVFGANRPRGILGWIIDGVLIGGGILVGFWVPLNIDTIANSIFPRQIDVTVGTINTACSIADRSDVLAGGQIEQVNVVVDKMNQIAEDTNKAIDGSATNMGLADEALKEVKAFL